EAVIELLSAPTTRIVSVTMTEGGYGAVDDAGDDSVFGLVTAALQRRREAGTPSPTIVSWDNIEGNGDVARAAFTRYADRVAPRPVGVDSHHHEVPQLDGGSDHAG